MVLHVGKVEPAPGQGKPFQWLSKNAQSAESGFRTMFGRRGEKGHAEKAAESEVNRAIWVLHSSRPRLEINPRLPCYMKLARIKTTCTLGIPKVVMLYV